MTYHPHAEKRILIISYSQSGDVARVADSFAGELRIAGAEVTWEALHPRNEYPFPWRSLRRFFDAMPESILGLPPPIDKPKFDPATRYDLVVIAYPVWFLSPAPPVQGFFKSSAAAVLKGADVITISVSRSMWHNASETMKRLLAVAGAYHRDQIAVTHQGSSLATLISTPRALLSGRRDSLIGVFPPAGVSEHDLARVRRLGRVVAGRLLAARNACQGPLLRGEPAVAIKRWSVVPELLAWYCFYGWAVAIRALGRLHTGLRALGVYAFAVFLVCLILFGLPATVLAAWLLSPAARHRLNGYVARLAAPTGLPRPPAAADRDPAASAGPEGGA
jgi:hypothetical protein